MIPAIVIITYNRPNSLQRLLISIKNANYQSNDINLIISIDCLKKGEIHPEILKIANHFDWSYGNKIIIQQKENIGLRQHVINSGNLTKKYGSIILLEDDIYVSPHFYQYAIEAIKFYRNDNKIAGISLYKFQQNFGTRLPFEPIEDGNDVFFMQFACSWGQIWTKNQWNEFISWYSNKPILDKVNVPHYINSWPESSWLKYFMIFIVSTDKYFVYPRISYTTNFGDAGTHNSVSSNISQVPISLGERNFRFINFYDSKIKYDVYYELLPTSLIDLSENESFSEDLCVDLYGSKPISSIKNKYIVTSKKCKYDKGIRFGLEMKPLDMNIVHNIPGTFFTYIATEYLRSGNVDRLILFEFLNQQIDFKVLSQKILFFINRIFQIFTIFFRR